MKQRSIFFILFFLSFLTFPLCAQVDCISTNRELESDRIEDLDGRYGLLIISASNDLVINATNSQQKPEVKVKQTGANGSYEYQVLFDATDTHRPKVEISHRGSVYTTSLVQLLKPDFLIAYKLVDTREPIRYDDQTQPTDVTLSETEASVEFTTNLSGLKVSVSDKLQAKQTSSQSSADKNITVTTVTFAVKTIKDMAETISKSEQEFRTREQKALSNSSTSDAEWEAIDALKAKVESLENDYARMVQIEIYTDQSNRLAISIEDMTKPRMKRCYAILPIVIEKEIYVTECSAYMKEGGRLFAQRDYTNAKTAYQNALTAKDVILSMKPTINDMITQCDSCIKYEKLATFSIKKIMDLRKSGNATQQETAKYAQGAIEFMTIANNYNPNEFYTSRIDKLTQMLSDFPLAMKFTCVEWHTLSEGAKLDGVEIWAAYGENPVQAGMLTNDRKFRKTVDDNPKEYSQMGITDADGICEVELIRSNLPTGVFFRPTGDDKKGIKIKYLSTDELMQKSSGSFMERQFRLRMYTKQ